MKDKLINVVTFVWNKLSISKRSNKKIRMDIIKFIVVYIIFVFTLFLIGWGFLWYIKGIPDLLLLLEGIKALSAPAVLAVVKFVCDSTSSVANKYIDKNKNGIPDYLERSDAQ